MVDTNLLGIYLNDHLAGATAMRELIKRSEGSNRGTELGSFLATLRGEVEADTEVLQSVMRRLDVGVDRLKQAFAWTGEKVGRLKLNGSLTAYSPLSRLVELDAIVLGLHGKLCLWRTLERAAPDDVRLAGFDFKALRERVNAQLRQLERHRRRAIDEAVRRPAPNQSAAP